RTVKKLAGEVFSKPVLYNENIDADLREYLNDIDLEGNNINVLGFHHFSDSIAYGVSHILVDYPEVNIEDEDDILYVREELGREIFNKQKEKELNLRPYCSIISASNVIGWRFEKINGVSVLSNVRIKDSVSVPAGTFGEEIVNRIRVLKIGSYETYHEGEDGYDLVSAGNTGLNYIPLFSFFTGGDKNGLVCDISLMGLAELNLEHWQSSSDQRNILHYARMITFLGVALDDLQEDKQIVMGCNQIVHTSDPSGDLRVIETSGKAIEVGSNDLRQLEKNMGLFGLGIEEKRPDRETATSNLLSHISSSSTLKNWALNYDDLYNNVVNCMMDYMNLSRLNENVIKVNTDLIPSVGSTTVQMILESYKEGGIDQETFLIEMKRRGLIRDGADIFEIMEKTKEEREQESFNDKKIKTPDTNNMPEVEKE
ncbi:MAG: DUF4055 domain-containing protein, partial [Candidatus Auribacterota bacterium]|nr:DUF4055 domain-containing protein [Candidatus Auribacterota bacterium]